MAMRVVTLEKLEDFIEDKIGVKPTVLKGSNCIRFINPITSIVSCYLPNSQVNNLTDEHPFLKFRDQVIGVIAINGSIVDEEEIKPYTFILD